MYKKINKRLHKIITIWTFLFNDYEKNNIKRKIKKLFSHKFEKLKFN